eukprot:5756149-Alexandrium_andersonii.AAC.1
MNNSFPEASNDQDTLPARQRGLSTPTPDPPPPSTPIWPAIPGGHELNIPPIWKHRRVRWAMAASQTLRMPLAFCPRQTPRHQNIWEAPSACLLLFVLLLLLLLLLLLSALERYLTKGGWTGFCVRVCSTIDRPPGLFDSPPVYLPAHLQLHRPANQCASVNTHVKQACGGPRCIVHRWHGPQGPNQKPSRSQACERLSEGRESALDTLQEASAAAHA